MPYLLTFTVVLCTIVVLDLVLTLGVVRRLREHGRLLTAGGTAGPRRVAMPPVGTRLGDFFATTTDGEPVARDLLGGITVVGFFAPGCGPCHTQVPVFVRYAGQFAGGRARALAIVLDDGADVAAMVDQLSPATRVVIEPPGGAMCRAFDVDMFPALGLIDDTGTVIADQLPAVGRPEPARA